MSENNQFFSLDRDTLHYVGRPLSIDPFFEECKAVLGRHIVPDHSDEHLWQSLAFCIASQFATFKGPSDLVKKLRNQPLENLRNPAFISEQAGKTRFPEDRFTKMWDFIKKYGGIEKLAAHLVHHPADVRKMLGDRKMWMGYKTSSFWYLCLGGTSLMTLDQHNFRQLAGLGIPMNEGFYTRQKRKSGKTEGKDIQKTPSSKQYTAIEAQAIILLSRCPEFSLDDHVNAALATTVFWWTGVVANKGYDHFSRSGKKVEFKPLYK